MPRAPKKTAKKPSGTRGVAAALVRTMPDAPALVRLLRRQQRKVIEMVFALVEQYKRAG